MTLFGELCSSGHHFSLFEAIRFKRHRQVLLLTEAGVDIDCRNNKGITPLIYVSIAVDDIKSRTKLAKLLLDAGADPNISDWDGMSPIMHAASRGQNEVVQALLQKKKTNVKLKDSDGNTVLMHSATNGQAEVLSTLISTFRYDMASLRLNHKNNQGFTAMQLAARNGHDDCARTLTKEAQMFPKAIYEFPDPRILDREPTPCGHPTEYPKCRFLKLVRGPNRSPTKNARTTSTIETIPVLKVPDLSQQSDSCKLSANTEAGTDLNANFSKTESPSKQSNGLPSAWKTMKPDYQDIKELKNKNTQTGQTTPKPIKGLEPINNDGDSSVRRQERQRTFTRISEQSKWQKLPRPRSSSQPNDSSRNTSAEDDMKRKSNGPQHCRNAWMTDASNTKIPHKRPESEPIILPIIPSINCVTQNTLLASNILSRKCSLQVNSSLFTNSPLHTEVEEFKNVFVHTS